MQFCYRYIFVHFEEFPVSPFNPFTSGPPSDFIKYLKEVIKKEERRSMNLWLLFYCIVCCGIREVISIETTSKRIAICVSGQISRWQPEFLFQNLIHVNPDQQLFLFFNLQTNNGTNHALHSSGIGFQPTKMSVMNNTEIQTHLNELLNASKHTEIVSINKHYVMSREHFVTVVNGPLDRLKQFNMRDYHPSGISVNIMNMYQAHINCADQILAYEQEKTLEVNKNLTAWRFDYIISTREDAYFYTPMNISALLPQLRLFHNPTPTTVTTDGNHGKCDIIFKNCLTFGGFNMRLQLFNRDSGIIMLGNRFKFYSIMHQAGWKTVNPECYEMMEAGMYDVIDCKVDIDYIPVTAARHLKDGDICLYDFENRECYPTAVEENIKHIKKCEDIEKTI